MGSEPLIDFMKEPEEVTPTAGDILKGIQGAIANYGSGGHQPYVEIMSPEEWGRRVEHIKKKESENESKV